jgi:uncharacterized protein (DUF2126 family)
MNSVLSEKSEIGIWYKKVEFELDRFIFVAPKPMPEEEWTKLCEQYGQHQTRVLAGDALLIDLRGKEPTFVSVPADYKPQLDVTVQAESSAEARRTVMEMFRKSCVVTGVSRVK